MKYALNKALFLVLGFALLASGCLTKPVTLQILHVNDLHSNLLQGSRADRGGYAALKAEIDRLKAQARSAGQETLVLNGGDSFEGSPYFFANHGSESMRALAEMNFDANVIGNHDFLMGGAEFSRLIGEAPASMPLIGGNIDFDRNRFPGLARNLKRYVQVRRGGLRFGIIGLVTDSPLYRWAAADVQVANPFLRAQKLVAEVRAQNDVVIVLSHLGTADDRRLAQLTAGIDLIVGAHDHTPLKRPIIVKNPLGINVPILQAEAFGDSIGRMIITVKPDRTYTIDSYGFVPVKSSGPKDKRVEWFAARGLESFENYFGREWLNEKISVSHEGIANEVDGGQRMGKLCAEAFKDSAKTDVAFDFADFHGMSLPAGPVTRRSLISMYPRVFEFSRLYGWTVWTMQLPGAVIEQLIPLLLGSPFHFSTAGLTYEVVIREGKDFVTNIKINGEPVDPLRVYTVAVPEGVARGLIEAPKLFKKPVSQVLTEISVDAERAVMGFVLQNLAAFNSTIKDTGVPVWTALEHNFKTRSSVD